MTLEKLTELLSGDYEVLVKAISVKPEPKTSAPLDEYYVDKHPVFDAGKRPDIARKNSKGERLPPRPVNRIGLAFEQMIVGRAAAFLCANPIVYNAAPEGPAEEKMWEAFKRINENNKLDYKNQDILEKRMSETDVAEIWYLEDFTDPEDDYWAGTEITATVKPRLFISCTSLLDKIWPVWDGQDNLIAFGREYTEKSDDGKDIIHFDLYTADTIYEGMKESADWVVVPKPNEVKKILVIYHYQKDVEWTNAKSLIRRLEFLNSNLADSNDKTMSPILHIAGAVDTLPDGTAGRVVKGPAETKIAYVTSDNAPASLKLEVDLLFKYMHITTDTVDISPEGLQNSNGEVTGVAMEFRFMPAHLKASKHAGTFGECIQRRINLIKRIIATIDPSAKEGVTLTITPKFDFFLPKDVNAIINYLSNAVGSDKPLLSQETAVAALQGAIGGDGKAEFDKILEEAEEASKAESGPGAKAKLDGLMNAV